MGDTTASRWIVALVIAATGLFVSCIFVFPKLIVQIDVDRGSPPPDLAKATNDVRDTLLKGLGGAVILTGVFLTGRQLRIAREGQITERFSRAIDQLGSSTLDVRLGGIYALERIAKNSEADRGVVIEVLTAYVREHSTWRDPAESGQPSAKDRSDVQTEPAIYPPLADLPWLHLRAPDVQAVMTVLKRLEVGRTEYADLWRVDLRRADLHSINLADAFLVGANLQGARLGQANLTRTYLIGTNLQGAYLEGADLTESRLTGVNLQGAHLRNAKFRKAYLGLSSTDVSEVQALPDVFGHDFIAMLGPADLRMADLRGADLRSVVLGEGDQAATFTGARADRATQWPKNFDLRESGISYEGN